MPLLSVAAHHSDVSDPTLLQWIMVAFTDVVNVAPLVVIIVIAVIVVAMPVAILALAIRARRGA
jgi:hypothetical protein